MALPDVMVDLESLATTADAVIVSIGAVKFDVSTEEIGDEGFYALVEMEHQARERRISQQTLQWWMGKDMEAARSVFDKSLERQHLEEVLESFQDWFWDHEPSAQRQATLQRNRRIWSNGANFDEPILSHAYTQYGMEIPWSFWNVKCFRTWKDLPGAGLVVKAVQREGTHHNALDDALHQARQAQAVHKKLFRK